MLSASKKAVPANTVTAFAASYITGDYQTAFTPKSFNSPRKRIGSSNTLESLVNLPVLNFLKNDTYFTS
jgi:hypothetical protein